jgi:2-phospho-L-lactate guanylyltransferase
VVTTADRALGWSVVVPVKPLRLAKSRLQELTPARRAELMLAMAVDTVTAALAAEHVAAVLVVTSDPRTAATMRTVGAEVIADEPDSGLNAALVHAAGAAAQRRPGNGIAALAADLPALTSTALDAALVAAASHRTSFVPDASGSGTTLLCARVVDDLTPMFGSGSAARHRATGATPLNATEHTGLCRDVDTSDDLTRAQLLGVGQRTAMLLGG